MTGRLADHFLKDLEDLDSSEDEQIKTTQTKPKEKGEFVGDSDSDDEEIPDAIDEFLMKK